MAIPINPQQVFDIMPERFSPAFFNETLKRHGIAKPAAMCQFFIDHDCYRSKSQWVKPSARRFAWRTPAVTNCDLDRKELI